MSDELYKLKKRLRGFAKDRDWEQFHNPKNLAMALSVEAAELLEVFQWLTQEESEKEAIDPEVLKRAREEMADVLNYTVRIADVLGVDLIEAANHKIDVNSEKYPIDLAKGNATKYNRRD